jgi:hypothetical protein
MEENEVLADAASLEVVAEEKAQVAPETEAEVEAPEGAETDEDRRKRENRERRDREKTYKQKLREQAAEAERKVEEAEARKRKIMEAGQRQAQPAESDFPDYTEFQMAKALWRAKQAERAEAASEAGSEVEEARKRAEAFKSQEDRIVAAQWAEQVADAKAKYADFEAVALSGDVPISDIMAEAIRTSDSGADVAYYLGRNRAVAAQIARMTPIEAARAIGRIEATLTAPKARTETSAPAPISPIKGKASPTKSVDAMSMDEYAAGRRAGKIR